MLSLERVKQRAVRGEESFEFLPFTARPGAGACGDSRTRPETGF